MITSRGFISLGLVFLIIIGFAVLGGAGWWSIKDDKMESSVDTSPIECAGGLQWQTNIEDKVSKAIGAGIDYSPPRPYKCVTFSLMREGSTVFNTGCASAYSPSSSISRRKAYDRAISYLENGPGKDPFYIVKSQHILLGSEEKRIAAQCLYVSAANWTDNGAYGPPPPPNLSNN